MHICWHTTYGCFYLTVQEQRSCMVCRAQWLYDQCKSRVYGPTLVLLLWLFGPLQKSFDYPGYKKKIAVNTANYNMELKDD